MLEENQTVQDCGEGLVSIPPSLQTFLRRVVGRKLVGGTARVSHDVRDLRGLLQDGELMELEAWRSHPRCSLPCGILVAYYKLLI